MRVKEPLWVKRPRSRVPMPNISYITRNTIVYMEAVLIFSAHANDAGHSYTRLTSDCVVARHTSCFTTRDGSGSGTSKLRIISKKACNLRYTFLPWSFTKNAPAGVATYKNNNNICYIVTCVKAYHSQWLLQKSIQNWTANHKMFTVTVSKNFRTLRCLTKNWKNISLCKDWFIHWD